MQINDKINFLNAQAFESRKKDSKEKSFDAKNQVIGKIPNPFLPSDKDYLKDYVTRGIKLIKDVSSSAVSKERFDAKVNEVKLTKMFLDSGYSLASIKENKDKIAELAKLDYDEIESKHKYYVENISRYVNQYQQKNLDWMELSILDSEGLNARDLDLLRRMSEIMIEKSKRYHKNASNIEVPAKIRLQIHFIKEYENFDIESTAKQKEFIKGFTHYFDDDFINDLSKNDDFLRIPLIADIKRCSSVKELQRELLERMKNKPVSAIKIDENIVMESKTLQNFSFENLSEAFKNVDLKKYNKGLPLKYSRQKFISDFNASIKDLKPQEKKQVFDYFQFSIDSKNDIIKYPIPNEADISQMPQNVQKAILKAKEHVDFFTFDNGFVLDEEDEKLQDVLNGFIKVFPEFLSIVGKIQHRGDSIDFHTLDDLKLCLENPKTKTLSQKEQEILFLSVMFHDIAKKETAIDDGHQVACAHYAKEIIKKLPISFEEKERIYNLILNSHWTSDNKSAEDLAATFRHPGDFEIAQILAKADSESAGFEYAPDKDKISETKANIKKIQENGIALFADNLPTDKTKFPKTEDGIMYLDFSDKEADLEQYGFRAGMKVKDLNMLCHSSTEKLDALFNICDDSKEICLSTSLLSAENGLKTYYNQGCSVILDSTNSDIALGGVHVGCTGGQRGFEDFKDYIYTRNTTKKNDEYKAAQNERERKEIPDFLKNELKLSNEEYVEFFNAVESYKNKRDIKDIKLTSERIIKEGDIKEALDKLHNNMLEAKCNSDYNNEVVVFQPKIQAIVMNKKNFPNSVIKDDETRKCIKENNIPVILV